VCFYLICIIIPKHFHWLATNFASIPTCIEGCYQEVLLLHCNINFIDFSRLVVDFRAVFLLIQLYLYVLLSNLDGKSDRAAIIVNKASLFFVFSLFI